MHAHDGFIGVDVGGTKVSVATLQAGRTGTPLVRPTALSDAAALLDQIAEQVREAAAGAPFTAVGVGIPSVVDFATGTVSTSVNIPLNDVPLRSELERRIGAPVYVDNDATVAAFAEAHDEHGRVTVRHLVMFTIGTGVGGGIVIDGRPYRGATGAAAELGHTLIAIAEPPPPPGRFPQVGSLESLAAGRVLDALAREAAAAHPESALAAALARQGEVGGHDAVTAAQAGDAAAIACLARIGRNLGIGIANAINTFDPDVVAIGGGVSAAGELLLASAREAAHEYVLPGVGRTTEIRIARSGPDAGVRGAALLARSEHHNDNGEAR